MKLPMVRIPCLADLQGLSSAHGRFGDSVAWVPGGSRRWYGPNICVNPLLNPGFWGLFNIRMGLTEHRGVSLFVSHTLSNVAAFLNISTFQATFSQFLEAVQCRLCRLGENMGNLF